MRSMFQRNLSTSGKVFTNERTGVSFKGILVLNQSKPRIDFDNNVDTKSNDWIVNSVGERLYVTELVPLSDSYKSCYYISECEYNQSASNQPAFHINANTIKNSIIGTQSNTTVNLNAQLERLRNDVENSDSNDKEELHKIISLLEELSKSNEPVPRNIFSKFSAVMERNSWISGSIAGFLLNLFLGL